MTHSILAIDPGPTESAWVQYSLSSESFVSHGIRPNEELRITLPLLLVEPLCDVVIEKVECYGMSVGAEVFDTCVWTGRFVELATAAGATRIVRMPRRDVKLHLCGSVRAKDANIRQRLIDMHGGKDAAIGKKAKPGPLYGIRSHLWAALALAITYRDMHGEGASDAK